MFTEDEFLTVSHLNHLIRDVINMGFPHSVWVCGEIQGYNRNREKKHIFFELCEKDSNTKSIVARAGLVIFSGRRAYIEEILKSAENAFQLKDDIEVKFLCKVDFYPPHGAMRLMVESIDPVYTLGKIAQERQKLLAKLKKEGILDKNKEIPLPRVPLHIGLITAYDSAAYNDFLSELKMSGFAFKVFYKGALMQGRGTESDVCQAIDDLNRLGNLDVIVITRGGGSIAELSCFDSEAIVQKIAASRLPVLSGIGHEINITVTDIAAHTHQKTPTAIARFLVERVESFLTDIEEKVNEIICFARQKVEDEKNRVDDQKAFLIKALPGQIKEIQTRICHFERIITLANPVNTLRRGFSITRTQGGKIVRGIGEIGKDDTIITRLSDGSLQSRIEGITREE